MFARLRVVLMQKLLKLQRLVVKSQGEWLKFTNT